MMKCAAYYRVSTDEQGASIEAQREGARAWCVARGAELVAEYADEGISGAEWLKREGVVQLQADVRRSPRPWDVLVVRDLDRLGRDTLRLGLLLEALHDHGARLHVWSTGEDVRYDAEQRALLMLKGVIAERERAMTSHRTRTGMKRLAESGAAVGGRPYGYRIERDAQGVARYVVDEREAEIVLEIYRRRAAGEPCRRIAMDLNRRGVASARAATGRHPNVAWYHTRVRDIASNPRYRGAAAWGKKGALYRQGTRVEYRRDESQVVTSPVSRIVDDALWQSAQRNTVKARAAVGGHVHRGVRPKYLLIGNSVCGICGGPMASTRTCTGRGPTSRTLPAYVCLRKREQGTCVWKATRPTARVDGVVLAWLLDEVLDPAVVRDGFERARAEALAVQAGDVPPALAAVRARVEDLERRVKRLVRAIEADDSPDVMTNLKERRAELAAARREAEAAEPAPEVSGADEEAELIARLTDLRPIVEAARDEEPGLVRDLLASLLTGPIVITPRGSGRSLTFDLKGEARPGALLDLAIPGTPASDGTRGMVKTGAATAQTTLRALRVQLRRVA